MLSLERHCLRNVTKSELDISCLLEENRSKQYLPHPVTEGGTMTENSDVSLPDF